mmetsp:Transcript_14056/g.21015  ORF Transcript_14056/g.21015 Transcript_14056/m.21015 type:complete len:611 (+) Transcript_14056:59-1891(+)
MSEATSLPASDQCSMDSKVHNINEPTSTAALDSGSIYMATDPIKADIGVDAQVMESFAHLGIAAVPEDASTGEVDIPIPAFDAICVPPSRKIKPTKPPRVHSRPPQFAPSPFVQALDACASVDVWATPSIIPGLHVPVKTGEFSISMNGFGSHLNNTGLLGDVAKRAAISRFADCAILSSSGTTSSNHKVMQMLAIEFKGRPVLVSRNCHHSIIFAANMYGVKLCFINNPGWLDKFDAMIPPSAADVKAALKRQPAACAVLISSPTYEGIVADIASIAEVVHTHRHQGKSTIMWVDQAWGSHFGTTPNVPPSAMQLGADIVCESTHKNGGAIQGSAVLLFKRCDKFEYHSLMEAHVKVETTSPNFPIFASMDAAYIRLKAEPELVDDLSSLITDIKEELAEDEGIEFLTQEHLAAYPNLQLDPTRLVVAFDGLSGNAVKQYLEENFIQVEKVGRRCATLIATFQLPPQAAMKAAYAIRSAINDIPRDESVNEVFPAPYENCPIDPTSVKQKYKPETVPAETAIGLISNETIECYPPGIPILLPGFTITPTAMHHLITMRDLGADIVAVDKTLATIRVRRPAESKPAAGNKATSGGKPATGNTKPKAGGKA